MSNNVSGPGPVNDPKGTTSQNALKRAKEGALFFYSLLKGGPVDGRSLNIHTVQKLKDQVGILALNKCTPFLADFTSKVGNKLVKLASSCDIKHKPTQGAIANGRRMLYQMFSLIQPNNARVHHYNFIDSLLPVYPDVISHIKEFLDYTDQFALDASSKRSLDLLKLRLKQLCRDQGFEQAGSMESVCRILQSNSVLNMSRNIVDNLFGGDPESVEPENLQDFYGRFAVTKGIFDKDLLRVVLDERERQQRLLPLILEIITEANLEGILSNIVCVMNRDWDSLTTKAREAYTSALDLRDSITGTRGWLEQSNISALFSFVDTDPRLYR